MEVLYEKVLREFGWLANLYALDYFVENHWQKLPNAWQSYFDSCIRHCRESGSVRVMITKLVEDILNERTCHFHPTVGPFPLSLIALKRCVSVFAANRQSVTSRTQIAQMCLGRSEDIGSESELTRLEQILPHRLRMKIKAKKEHEIERIFDLLDIVLRHLSPDKERKDWQLVDVGSGVGHLSRILSLLLRTNVSTIEGNAAFVATSLEIDKYFKRAVDNNQRNVCIAKWQMPTRQLAFVDANDNLSVDESRSILVGLHACGDLSSTILRNFVRDPNAKILLSAGCCYHKLNGGRDKLFRDEYGQDENITQLNGYPLSQRFQTLQLPYASRELACFSIECFRKKLRELMNSEVLFVNAYRAILEWLIVGCPFSPTNTKLNSINPKLRHRGLHGVKNAENMSFWKYAEETLRGDTELCERVVKMKQSPETTMTVKRFIDEESERILIIYALRLVIAPLIETILLEDRRLYLEENRLKANIAYTGILPLFDNVISPRNMVLLALKKKS